MSHLIHLLFLVDFFFLKVANNFFFNFTVFKNQSIFLFWSLVFYYLFHLFMPSSCFSCFFSPASLNSGCSFVWGIFVVVFGVLGSCVCGCLLRLSLGGLGFFVLGFSFLFSFCCCCFVLIFLFLAPGLSVHLPIWVYVLCLCKWH